MRVNSRSSIAGECITNRRGCQSKATRTSRTSALFQDILDGCHGRTSARVAAQRGPRRELGSGSVRVLSGWRRAHAGEEVGAGVALHQPIADVGQTLRVGDRRQQLRQAFGGGHSLDHSAARSTNGILTSSNFRISGNSTPLGTSRCTICRIQSANARRSCRSGSYAASISATRAVRRGRWWRRDPTGAEQGAGDRATSAPGARGGGRARYHRRGDAAHAWG